MAVLGGESDCRKWVTGSLFLSSSMASLPLWSGTQDSDQIIVELNFFNCEPQINISNFMYLHQVLFYFNDKGIASLRVRTKNTVDRFWSRIDPVEKRISQLKNACKHNV